jgi:hypothetical protein
VELRGGKGPARVAEVKAVGLFAPRAGAGGADGDEDRMPLLVELEPTERPQIINAEVWVVERKEG